MNWSFKEKSVAIVTITLAVLYGAYFVMAVRIAGSLKASGQPAIGVLFIVVTALVVITITIAHIIAAISNFRDANQGEDERDQQIERTAEARSSIVLGVGAVITAIAGIYGFFPTFVLGNIIFFFLVVSEITKGVLQIRYYRRGI